MRFPVYQLFIYRTRIIGDCAATCGTFAEIVFLSEISLAILTWIGIFVMMLFVSCIISDPNLRRTILYIGPWCHILSNGFEMFIMILLPTCFNVPFNDLYLS